MAKETKQETTAPTGPSDALQKFREAAQRQAERIPGANVILDEGQQIAGRVRKLGKYIHPQFGTSPVVVFEPGEAVTDVPVVMLPNASEGTPIGDLPSDHALVVVGIGDVLRAKLALVEAGDLLYMERHPDQTSGTSGFVYRNYTVLCSRHGRPPKAIEDFADEVTAQAVARLTNAGMVPGEEPF